MTRKSLLIFLGLFLCSLLLVAGYDQLRSQSSVDQTTRALAASQHNAPTVEERRCSSTKRLSDASTVSSNTAPPPRDPNTLTVEEITDDFMRAAFGYVYALNEFDEMGFMRTIPLKHLNVKELTPWSEIWPDASKYPELGRLHKWTKSTIDVGLIFYMYSIPQYEYAPVTNVLVNENYFDDVCAELKRLHASFEDHDIPIRFRLIGPSDLHDYPEYFNKEQSLKDGRYFFATGEGPFKDPRWDFNNIRTEQFKFLFDLSFIFRGPIPPSVAGGWEPPGYMDRGSRLPAKTRRLAIKAPYDALRALVPRFRTLRLRGVELDVPDGTEITKGRCVFRILKQTEHCLLWSLGLAPDWLIQGQHAYHFFLLRLLYDPRLNAGMTQAEVRDLLPEIISDTLTRVRNKLENRLYKE